MESWDRKRNKGIGNAVLQVIVDNINVFQRRFYVTPCPNKVHRLKGNLRVPGSKTMAVSRTCTGEDQIVSGIYESSGHNRAGLKRTETIVGLWTMREGSRRMN